MSGWDEGEDGAKGMVIVFLVNTSIHVPSSERFPTSIPAAREGFLFGVRTLMSLDMFHAPEYEAELSVYAI